MRRIDTPQRDEHGVTLLELLTLVAIVGTIANIAIPGSLVALERARAASIVSDFLSVREAAFQRYANEGAYPASAAQGVCPPELQDYVEPGFQWVRQKPAFEFKWEYWIDEEGEPRRPSTGVQVGLTIVAAERNPRLFDTIESIYDGPFVRISPKRAIFVIEPVPE